VNPNILRMGGIFGNMNHSSETPFRKLPRLPDIKYSGTTDKNGEITLQNIPASTRFLDVEHSHFQLPVDDQYKDRTVRFSLTPGATKTLGLTLQPIGKDFLGTSQ
ncbi:MAG: hypothetical protein JWM99_25, partial [Verrucomicrobiales bacterium]|nr:hypothetical protein [Verrucomicrobiales bacterium]